MTGVIRVRTKGGLSHGGISVNLSGRVTFIMSSKSVGMIDSIYNSLKPITLADYTTQVCKSGKLYPIPTTYAHFHALWSCSNGAGDNFLNPSASHALTSTIYTLLTPSTPLFLTIHPHIAKLLEILNSCAPLTALLNCPSNFAWNRLLDNNCKKLTTEST